MAIAMSLISLGGKVRSAVGDLMGGDASHLPLVVRGAASVLMVRIVGAMIMYGLQVLLAHWMGVFEYGVFAYAWVWVTVLGVLGAIGFNRASLRFVSDYHAKSRTGRLKGYLQISRGLVLAASILFMLLGWAVLDFGRGAIHDYYIVPMYLAMACIPFFGLTDMQECLARGLGSVNIAYMPSYIVRPSLILLGAATLYFFGGQPTGTHVMEIAFGACVVAFSLQYILLRRQVPLRVKRAQAYYHVGHWTRVAMPFLMVELFNVVMTNADVVLTGRYLSPADVAIYFASMRTCNLLLLIFFAMSALAIPTYSSLHAMGASHELRQFVRKVGHVIFWPSLAAAVALLLVGKYLLGLFGGEFVSGYWVMLILIGGILAKALTGPVEGLLSVTGHQDWLAAAMGFGALVDIVLNVTLIPLYGIIGAAIATSASTAATVIWMYALARQRLGIDTFVFARK
jgi:O-antigen/teichoic acid export membrane protein